ncbi:MAG: septal ring lytic transglycosylase RlpA family protein [Gammaproteobacteria bacterium]|nr:septal ring lytic transglycosylase RlpA family protein [Gammaproteobacteria bacterium]
MKKADGYRQQGIASWYGTKFHGHRTSSGESYNMYAMTAAHKTLPLPSYVRVTNLYNQRSIVVRVNDRGPFHDDRIIDLSYVAAKKLGMTGNGTAKVQVTYIDPRKKPASQRVSAFKNRPYNSTHLKHEQAKSPAKQFFLQIGAYSEQKNAEQMRQRVADLLENGEINTGYNVESKLYRVRIGPLASAQEADQLASKLSQSGISNSKVIID